MNSWNSIVNSIIKDKMSETKFSSSLFLGLLLLYCCSNNNSTMVISVWYLVSDMYFTSMHKYLQN